MPREDSRSPTPDRLISPNRQERRRSRSPGREGNRRRPKEGGFKWKEKRGTDEREQNRNGDSCLDRGYRDHYRARSPQRNSDQDDRDQQQSKKDTDPPRKKKERKEKKEKATAIPASGEAMIIVNVNDRLGTKAAIPCYASDPISQHPCSQ